MVRRILFVGVVVADGHHPATVTFLAAPLTEAALENLRHSFADIGQIGHVRRKLPDTSLHSVENMQNVQSGSRGSGGGRTWYIQQLR